MSILDKIDELKKSIETVKEFSTEVKVWEGDCLKKTMPIMESFTELRKIYGNNFMYDLQLLNNEDEEDYFILNNHLESDLAVRFVPYEKEIFTAQVRTGFAYNNSERRLDCFGLDFFSIVDGENSYKDMPYLNDAKVFSVRVPLEEGDKAYKYMPKSTIDADTLSKSSIKSLVEFSEILGRTVTVLEKKITEKVQQKIDENKQKVSLGNPANYKTDKDKEYEEDDAPFSSFTKDDGDYDR